MLNDPNTTPVRARAQCALWRAADDRAPMGARAALAQFGDQLGPHEHEPYNGTVRQMAHPCSTRSL